MPKTLAELHSDVPPDYYDRGIQTNIFQRIWHMKRFDNMKNFLTPLSGKILDVGCHSGLFTEKIKNGNPSLTIYGIDISRPAIIAAKKRIPSGHFTQADAHTLPFENNFFDHIFCLEMLEHVEKPDRVIREMKRVLKKNGTGVILIPTDSALFACIWSIWNYFSHVWTHTHIQNFNEKKLTKLLEDAGLQVTKRKKTHLSMLLLVEFKK